MTDKNYCLQFTYLINSCRLLNSHREILPDVPAVYFISPTDENVEIICDDLNKVREKITLAFKFEYDNIIIVP